MHTFTNLYSLSKTLRFELKPVGKTKENIEKAGLITQDEERATAYQKVKKIIDEYHKWFIAEALESFELDKEALSEYYLQYHLPKAEGQNREHFEKIQKTLRESIGKQLTTHPIYKQIDKKELLKGKKGEEALLSKIIPNLSDELLKSLNIQSHLEAQKLIEGFGNFTTYFSGFHTNRKNMYSSEEQSTAIAYRLIHENLPRFIDNAKVYEKLKTSDLVQKMPQLCKDLESIIQVNAIDDMFCLNYFNQTLSQKGIDVYNHLLGGYTPKGGKKIQGLNELINLYNQDQKDKNNRLPKLKPLYKQILSDRDTASFIPEMFESDESLLEAVQKGYENILSNVLSGGLEDGRPSLMDLLGKLKEYELSKIYIKNDLSLTQVSKSCFNHWGVIEEAWNYKYDLEKKNAKQDDKYVDERKKAFKRHKSFSIQEINDLISLLHREYSSGDVAHYFMPMNGQEEKDPVMFFTNIENHYNAIKDLLNTPYQAKKKLSQNKAHVRKIKEFLDSIKALQHFIKPLLGAGDEAEKEERFYGEFLPMWEKLDDIITPLYNKVRNYMTQKPYSTDKFKLNFENATLLDGWDVNKECDNSGVLLRKNGLYYLALMNKNHNTVFQKKFSSNEESSYEKINYKYFPDASKMIPKCSTQTKEVVSHFKDGVNVTKIIQGKNFISELEISKKIFDLNNKVYDADNRMFVRKVSKEDKRPKQFQKEYVKQSGDDRGFRDALNQWIDFCKDFVSKYQSTAPFSLQFSKTENYQSLDEFYKDIVCYSINYSSIPEGYIDQLVEEGKIYLFQIYNKDFSLYTKGTPNMHTLYWRALFDPSNLNDVKYKLNGEAEVFYRKKSIDESDKIVHKAHESINNKNELNKKKQSIFEYDIVKDKRFTMDKFQFHVPITLNFQAEGSKNINNKVNEYIQMGGVDHVIGIDRGERHLLYLTVVDLNGNIVEQRSLNEIVNSHRENTYQTNYHKLLDQREGSRDKSRKDWDSIESIKELKEGYLSQVIHQVAQLMVQYKAIVVLEDLNFGFMRGRQKVEKQIYQKFEKMLIEKLNYLVDKKKNQNEAGGVLQAFQFANKFESFQKLNKQSGFLFYIPAWNTSKIDPTTGFVNLIDTRYHSVEKARHLFEQFDTIRFNENKNYFEFEVKDYRKFSGKAEGTRLQWTICTYGERIKTFRNPEKNSEWDNQVVMLSEEWKKLFAQYNISLDDKLKEELVKQDGKPFFKEALFLLKLTLQMRNSLTGTEEDYLISPVMNEQGTFYDSRCSGDLLPKDADANGAYNIARKGLWVINQIKEAKDLKKLKLAISNKEWLKFAQKKK